MTKQQLQKLAVHKAKGLAPNQQIRLTGDEASYWVVNFAGILHIGYCLPGVWGNHAAMEPFYPGRDEFTMSDKEGKAIMKLQRLRGTL